MVKFLQLMLFFNAFFVSSLTYSTQELYLHIVKSLIYGKNIKIIQYGSDFTIKFQFDTKNKYRDAWIDEKYENPYQTPAKKTQEKNRKHCFLNYLINLSDLGVSKCKDEKDTYILDMKNKKVRLIDAITTNQDWKSLREKLTDENKKEENTQSIPWVATSKEAEELLAVYAMGGTSF